MLQTGTKNFMSIEMYNLLRANELRYAKGKKIKMKEIDLEKSDIYSVGLTLLCIIYL
jgi:hypothetical protein